MYRRIEEYLDELREKLKGCDRATIQDALGGAEDHLTTALEAELEARPDATQDELLERIVVRFGSPSEVAEHYREVEGLTSPALAGPPLERSKNRFLQFCAILADPGAWGALLYMVLSILTGATYFGWAIAGVYLSIALLIFIIGLPVTWLVLVSFRGVALVEGRIVEALLGVRMPRRAVSPRDGGSWWSRFKSVVKTRSTWTSILYMIILMPLGIIYSTVTLSLIAVGLAAIADPVIEHIVGLPLYEPDVYVPLWLEPLVVAAGFMVIVLTFHLAKVVGRLHGRMAKAMLVS